MVAVVGGEFGRVGYQCMLKPNLPFGPCGLDPTQPITDKGDSCCLEWTESREESDATQRPINRLHGSVPKCISRDAPDVDIKPVSVPPALDSAAGMVALGWAGPRTPRKPSEASPMSGPALKVSS